MCGIDHLHLVHSDKVRIERHRVCFRLHLHTIFRDNLGIKVMLREWLGIDKLTLHIP